MNRNAWKTQEWSIGEQVGWELWEMSTRQYFRWAPVWLLPVIARAPPPCANYNLSQPLTCNMRVARYKWGLPQNGTTDCEVEVEVEDGRKLLRQYPFETVMDLLPRPDSAAPAPEAEHARRLF